MVPELEQELMVLESVLIVPERAQMELKRRSMVLEPASIVPEWV